MVTPFLGTETTILFYTPPFLVNGIFFPLPHLTTKRLFVFGVRQRHCGNEVPKGTGDVNSNERRRFTNYLCVSSCSYSRWVKRHLCQGAERWEFATSRKGALLTDWSFFLAAFASSDTSRLLWKQEVIITSIAFHGFYISKFYTLVTQWLKCHFYLKPSNISVFLAWFLTHWCY